jgi:pilus assembly protein CpaE
MLVQHPHLVSDIQVAVVVTELTLAAARDTIRILSWLKSNAPHTQVVVVANRVPAGAQLEISRKDFEGSIERKLDFVVAYDQKLAAQAAKLGKPMAEAGKGSKTIAPLAELAKRLMAVGDTDEAAGRGDKPGKSGGGAKSGSLMGKFADLKSLMPRGAAKSK